MHHQVRGIPGRVGPSRPGTPLESAGAEIRSYHSTEKNRAEHLEPNCGSGTMIGFFTWPALQRLQSNQIPEAVVVT